MGQLLSKVERAEKHIRDVQAERDAFLAEDPYPFFHEDDLQSGERVYYLRSARDVPGPILCVPETAWNDKSDCGRKGWVSLTFDLYRAVFSQSVIPVTAPWPLFRVTQPGRALLDSSEYSPVSQRPSSC